MPGQWSAEHRAAFEATIAARRAADAAGRERPMPGSIGRRARGTRHRADQQATQVANPIERIEDWRPEHHAAIRLDALTEPQHHLVDTLVKAGGGPALPAYRPRETPGATQSHAEPEVAPAHHDVPIVLRVSLPAGEGQKLDLGPLTALLSDIRTTAERTDNRLALLREAPDWAASYATRLFAIEREQAATAKMLGTLSADLSAALTEIRKLASRPAKVIEFRPSHRRVADGGVPARQQRRAAGAATRQHKGPIALPERSLLGVPLGRMTDTHAAQVTRELASTRAVITRVAREPAIRGRGRPRT